MRVPHFLTSVVLTAFSHLSTGKSERRVCTPWVISAAFCSSRSFLVRFPSSQPLCLPSAELRRFLSASCWRARALTLASMRSSCERRACRMLQTFANTFESSSASSGVIPEGTKMGRMM